MSNINGVKKISFGTDGIRGVANKDLTPELAMMVARCAANEMCAGKKGSGRVLVGKDTRVSGDMLEAAMVAGVLSTGADVWRIGIAPTPMLAYLTKAMGCDFGVMISASHNPVEDNGIKIFSGEGFKLEGEIECAIQDRLNLNGHGVKLAGGGEVGCSVDKSNMSGEYINFLRKMLKGVNFKGKIVVDCAFGAASRFARRVFNDVADEVVFIHSDEDGRKINVDCGSTRPQKLQKLVLKQKARLGFAFDGDADRVLFVDENGQLVDGDQLMLLCARKMKKDDRLKGDTVVATVMSNMGFEKALGDSGIKMLRAPVGDKYVLREMLDGGFVLGGEQSGHIIFLDKSTTGDGLLTAAQVLSVASKSKDQFSRQTYFKHSSQYLKNVRVPDKEAFYENKKIQNKVIKIEKALGEKGRVVVRPSGTEPVIRVMVEAWDDNIAESYTDEIINKVKEEFNLN